MVKDEKKFVCSSLQGIVHFFHHYHERTKCKLGGGGGAGRSKADVSFFQNSKLTAITSLFYCSFTRTRLGGGREYAKGVRFVRL